MINKFIPYFDKILIKPIKSDSIFDEGKMQRKGEVIAIGKKVTFVKVGDVLYFERGVDPIQGEEDYYVVSESDEFILGKNEKEKKSRVGK